ncbi:acyl-CoA dehydrogenase [Paenibacillus sp. LHD-117]|uniref:acyl-CoA dehydrogenase n=1 Tax=Paenibacillus sp. LHD-117 TaxID=3071412 RepID=UPI0027DF4DD3|nr:acyl-CoA dehydrogenase [Paenibacillus sp. LHD-117]MDQ6421562.1 acyl-CoA dehydrogenase [Paenibacillus sp. LHD-117]
MLLPLTNEQEALRAMVKDFAKRDIAACVADMEDKDEFPLALIRKMGELGFMGIAVPESYGGAGADYLSSVIAIHEISKVSAAVGVIVSVHSSVGTNPILYDGDENQRSRYVPRLAAGEALGAFALTEPSAGSDSAGIRMTAVRQGDRYVLNGTKTFITNGGYADTYVTFAVTDRTNGTKGISAFIVEKGTPGLTVGKREKKLGLHGSSTTELIFENAEVPADCLIGREGDGFRIALDHLDAGRIGIAAQALGIAEAALACSFDYAGKRHQFGKPIASHQAISFKLADMATGIEAARLLVYQAAAMRSRGLPCGKEASMAKRFCSDTAMACATEAVQIFGGYGYMREYPAERLFRDAKVTQIYEGTNEIQRLVIFKHLLKEGG